MFGDKAVATIFGWKHRAFVKHQPQRRRVRLDQDIGNGDSSLQISTLSEMSRILVVPDVEPGPAEERSFPHPSDVIRHQIIAQSIALVDRTIHLPIDRMHGKTCAISNPGRERSNTLSLGIKCQNGGAIRFGSQTCTERILAEPGLQIAYYASNAVSVIASGANRHQHSTVVRREDQVSCRVSASARQGGNHLRLSRRPEIARGIMKANHSIRVGNVDPLRIVTVREEGNPKGLIQSARKNLIYGRARLSVCRPQNPHPALSRFCDEDVAIWCDADLPRTA